MAEGEKTHDPTTKRREDAAKRGDVWQSRELGTALVGIATLAAAAWCGPALVAGCAQLVAQGLGAPGDPPAIGGLVVPLAVMAGLIVVAGIAGPLLLGARWSGQAAAPKASRLDPLAGCKRMIGPQGLIELGKALVKAVLLGGVGWAAIDAPLIASGDLMGGAARLGGQIVALLAGLAVALAIVAALDLPLTRAQWWGKLRMTLQEVRDEHKESEGSSEVRAQQRQRARAAARAALHPAMADATVVTVNPAEFAVALRYVPGRDACPVVVAKGRDVVAAAIRDLAAENKVPVLRYPQLTRGIFFTAKVGAPIRDDLFGAVAAVLAYVFSVDRDVPPEVAVPPSAHFDADGRRV
ncbi:EscU/YscU/HrcU family type III secretion system export apparatus switch protein [Glacieibacterium frigidum]|uniref:Flagellar biosynthesis protein FlhB n=1 Tax=Glacieibacterium frigidum TaxID=2593303 RepID=A0A552U789_9SPHN|nr:EscU/YscU/HrcU family type III secretion system export apparatus switch protein [Glacieibacterium frigidum]TRW14087.1 flagellar biosynthesis protein FlhB [Glacieibacterium frigidum]